MVEVKEFNIDNKKIKIVAASAIGRDKIENQDNYSLNFIDDTLIIVLGDGLGSAPFSNEGSKKISECSPKILLNEIIPSTILDVKTAWKNTIKSDFDKYDTTFKFLKIDKNQIVCGGVGDGWICGLTDTESFSLEADHTFSNQTDTILSIDLISKFRIKKYCIANTSTFLIATDGFSEDMQKGSFVNLLEDAHASINSDISAFADELDETLKNWPVSSNTDDKTVIFVSVEEE